MERDVHSRTVVSVSWHDNDPFKRVGLVQRDNMVCYIFQEDEYSSRLFAILFIGTTLSCNLYQLNHILVSIYVYFKYL